MTRNLDVRAIRAARRAARRAVRQPGGRPPAIRALFDGEGLHESEIIVDNFAGGGGASLGKLWATGRSPDIAINHDPEAIAMHRVNHPSTRHYIEDVWQVDPRAVCEGRPVGLAWFSPTCSHFSPAKGGELDASSVELRALAWVVTEWAALVRPRIICVENVCEFLQWGPLHRQHSEGCPGVACAAGCSFGKKRRGRRVRVHHADCPGRACRKGCWIHKPIKERASETYHAWENRLKRLGYDVEARVLTACDYGAPTRRKRVFIVARCDGRAIAWPEPTHGPGRAHPYRAAAEVIDWSIPCPSIFGREKSLVDNTLKRLARGVWEFVVQSARPFLLPVNHGGVGRDDRRVHSVEDPMRTITASCRGSHALAVPYLIHRSNGERPGQAPRIYDPQQPIGTLMAQGQKHAACAAFLAKHFSDRATGGWAGGQPLDRSIGAITTRDHHSLVAANLVAANLVKFYGTSSVTDVTKPLDAVTAGGWKHALETAYLARYNGQGDAARLGVDQPIGVITTKDRYALVSEQLAAEESWLDEAQLARARMVADLLRRFGYPVGEFVWVTIDGERYIVADLCMRMLASRELYSAQGFPPDYIIAPEYDGRPLSKTAQVRMVGNSVPPRMAEVVAGAQLTSGRAPETRMAA